MASGKNLRAPATEPASDPEHVEETLQDAEETATASEAGPSAAPSVPIEDMAEDELLRGAWQGSHITEEHILRLRRRRQIPEGVLTRVPPSGEIEPKPEAGEYVVFYAHFDRGFALPISNFTRFTMNQFLLQPHHLPANAGLIMSVLAACIEAYIGVRPTKHIWAKYFLFARQHLPKVTPKVTVQCAVAAVMPRKNTVFPQFAGLKSCKKW